MIPLGILGGALLSPPTFVDSVFLGGHYDDPPTNVYSVTFPGVNLGADHPGRILCVTVAARATGTNGSVSRVMVGGHNFNYDVRSSSDRGVSSIWSGTAQGRTADITVTFVTQVYWAAIGVYVIPVGSVPFGWYTGSSTGTSVSVAENGMTVASATTYGQLSRTFLPSDKVITDLSEQEVGFGHSTTPGTYEWSLGTVANAYTKLTAMSYGPPAAPLAPDQIPGLRFWLDGSGLIGNDGDPISEWVGRSGSPSMLQTDPLKQPSIATVDGFKVADFSGSHFLENSTIRGLDSNQTVIVVSKGASTIGSTDRWVWGTSSGTGVSMAHRSTSAARFTVWGGDWANATWPSQPLETWGIRAGRYHYGQSMESRLNAGEPVLSPTTTVTTRDRWSMVGGNAGSASYPGQIAEVIHYSRALSDAEWDSVTTYLMNKYGTIL